MRITYTVIFVVVLALHCARADDKSSAPDLSQFSNSKNFNLILSVQTNVAWQIKRQGNILAVTDFDYGNDKIVDQYFISQNGKGYSWRWVPDWAHQPGKKIKQSFSEGELTNLKSEIAKLPSDNLAPPLQRLVIVSFESETNWVTHTYDRQSLPKTLLNICQIADLGIETNNQK